VDLAAAIVIATLSVVAAVVALGIFVWAARRDGQDQRRRDIGRRF
jgi:hypothetical protein